MKKLVLILPLLGILYASSPKYLLARSVECYTQYGPCPAYLTDGLDSFKNYPLLRPLPAGDVRRILTAFPQVKSVSLFRRLPSTLVVSVDLRRPFGQVLGSQTAVYGLVDEEGVIFSQTESRLDLPLLSLPEVIVPNSRLAANQGLALQALNAIWQLTSSLPTGQLSGSELQVSLPTGPQIIIGADAPVTSWYPPLHLILTRSKMGSKLPKKIDLRFTHPVLTY